jgi:subtilisin family serine protease
MGVLLKQQTLSALGLVGGWAVASGLAWGAPPSTSSGESPLAMPRLEQRSSPTPRDPRPVANAAAPDTVGGFASDRVILRLAPGATAVRDGAHWVLRVEGISTVASRESFAEASVERIRPALRRGAADALLASALGLDRFVVVEVPRGSDAVSLRARFAQLEGVELAELDGIGGLAGDLPDDPRFPEQWNLRNIGQTVAGVEGVPGADIDALGAWSRTTGSGNVVVAILDSGVNPHVDLAGRILPGWNVPLDTDDTTDVCGSHGTGVASLLGGRGGDGLGMAGVDWNVKFLPIVVVNPCSGAESYVAEGLVFATDAGAAIANMSLQYFAGTEFLRNAVLYAHASGVTMVAATGNGTSSTLAFPAQWPETIAVGASNNLDLRWSNSRWGVGISLVAPGQRVLCASGTTTHTTRDGTSFAAPHVSGTASLMLAVNPYLDAESIREILEATTVDLDEPGYDLFTGSGRLDAAAAVAAVPAPGDVDRDGHVNGADLAIVLGSWGACLPDVSCEADVDRSGTVDGVDLSLVLGGWTG